MGNLIYLAHPLAGDRDRNIENAVLWLAWAHRYTEWGLWVQCPWLASARAELLRGTTEIEWKAEGGIEVEGAVLRGYAHVMRVGPVVSTGTGREGRSMLAQGGNVYDYTHHRLTIPPKGPLEARVIVPSWPGI